MIGVDVGISTTVAVDTHNLEVKKSIISPSKRGVASRLLGIVYDGRGEVAVTGAGAMAERESLNRICEPAFIDEIGAIGIGGSKLFGLKRCIVVSMGTGTAIVYVNGKKCEHLGGTGVGGGTILGLGRRLLDTYDPEEIAKLSEQGTLKKVNLTVGDIYGSGIGIVPADATASNFEKKGRCSKSDNALGILNLVGETVGVLACFAAREKKTKDIVFVGTVPTMQVVADVLRRTTGMFGFGCRIPGEPAAAVALGAVLCFEYNIYIK
ncbi:MAG: hypothetical protein ABIG39_04535 [Candidatus Micrarchaeota archaeon]